jgi:hypothetical protein
MRWPRRLDLIALIAAMAASRLLFRSHFLYDLDSVNFALGTLQFDPKLQQPHPPGYFLYVMLGRLMNALVHDTNLAFVLISIAASCGTVWMIYRLGLEWFGLDAARIAGLIFLFSPLAWFHGVVALSYSVEAFFSVLLAYLCWRIKEGEGRIVPAAAIVLGVASGFRPSTFLFLAPLFFYSIRRAGAKRITIGFACLGVSLAAWFLPMIAASGGFSRYFGALFFLWDVVPSRHTVFNSSPVTSIARAAVVVGILALMFGAALLIPLTALKGARPLTEDAAQPAKKTFTVVWILPALLFFTFIFLKFVNSGYLLLLAPAGCLWLGHLAAQRFQAAGRSDRFKAAILVAAAAVNTWIFIASPFYFSWRSIHRFETNLRDIQRALPLAAPQPGTVIVGFDSHFLGFRHAGYYLPGYLTVLYPELDMKSGIRVFAMRHRSTALLSSLPTASYRRFVIFPLPAGEQYRKYENEVLSKLPPQDLQIIQAGGRRFVTGPASDLVYLFPKALAAVGGSGVYAETHRQSQAVNHSRHP